MNRYLPLLVVIVGVLLVIGACIVGNQKPRSFPIDTTCREIRDNPASYVGCDVIVTTAGTEVMNDQLVWRLHSPGEPDIIFSFADGRIPDPIPVEVTGHCLAPVRGGPVRIVNCR